MKVQRLPAGFRHLFTKKEIRDLENEMGVRFSEVTYGHITNSQKINTNTNHISLHPVSLSGRREGEIWIFNFHQSGFRAELLTDSLESVIKQDVALEIKRYMAKAANFIDTDFIQRPQLWVYCFVNQNKIEIKSRELS